MYPTSATSVTRISPGSRSSIVSGRTMRTRPRTRPLHTPTPCNVSPTARMVAKAVVACQWPVNIGGGWKVGQPDLFSAAARHYFRHLGRQCVEFVDQQVEHVVGGVEHTLVRGAAARIPAAGCAATRWPAPSCRGGLHGPEAVWAASESDGTGSPRNLRLGCWRSGPGCSAIWRPFAAVAADHRRSWPTASTSAGPRCPIRCNSANSAATKPAGLALRVCPAARRGRAGPGCRRPRRFRPASRRANRCSRSIGRR